MGSAGIDGISGEKRGENWDEYDQLKSDPGRPLPTYGGRLFSLSSSSSSPGVKDQRKREESKEVLVYTSSPLREDVLVVGRVFLYLFCSSAGRDGDWVARICDVRPSGFSVNVGESHVRARYKRGLDNPKCHQRGETMLLSLDMGGMLFI